MADVMEGPEAAYAQSDLYADVMAGGPVPQTTNGQFNAAPVSPTGNRSAGIDYKSYTTVHPKSVEQQERETKIAANVADNQEKGKQLYIGGLTWWTNDEELARAIRDSGVNDLISIKFFENRINGQSKGFALVEVASDASQRLCLEKVPHQILHNQKPTATYVNKQTLTMFEAQARKDMPGLAGGDKRDDRERKPHKTNYIPYNAPHNAPHNAPPQIITGMPPPGANIVNAPMLDHALLQHQGLPMPPTGFPPGSIVVDAMGNIIQGGVPPGLPPGMMHPQPGGPMQPMPPRPGVAPHINPAFIPQDGAPPIDPMTGLPLHTTGLNEQDLESMRRNQAVASTAIQRAMTDANAGEFESGIETLVTAISLINQSTTATSEPAQVLVQSLQDCLQSLEGQLVQKGAGHRQNRYDDYREHDRDRRRRRDRSHSRSRSRERSRRSYSPRRSRSRERRRR